MMDLLVSLAYHTGFLADDLYATNAQILVEFLKRCCSQSP